MTNKKDVHEDKVKYWIKTHLHKDGTPQWDGVVGKIELERKIKALKAWGYNPTIDHSMTEK